MLEVVLSKEGISQEENEVKGNPFRRNYMNKSTETRNRAIHLGN